MRDGLRCKDRKKYGHIVKGNILLAQFIFNWTICLESSGYKNNPDQQFAVIEKGIILTCSVSRISQLCANEQLQPHQNLQHLVLLGVPDASAFLSPTLRFCPLTPQQDTAVMHRSKEGTTQYYSGLRHPTISKGVTKAMVLEWRQDTIAKELSIILFFQGTLMLIGLLYEKCKTQTKAGNVYGLFLHWNEFYCISFQLSFLSIQLPLQNVKG